MESPYHSGIGPMAKRTELLLSALAHSNTPVTAAELAAKLGVTDRSIRNYVARLNADGTLVQSGPLGYELVGQVRPAQRSESSPDNRVARLLRTLIDARAGLDVYETSAALFVSESTLESDLGKIRARLDGTGLKLQRTGDRVRLIGPESGRRRVLSSLFREESQRDILELDEIQREFPAENLEAFKHALIAALEAEQFTLNEYSINNVLLHVVIALDRVERFGTRVDDEGSLVITGRSPAHHEIRRILSSELVRFFPTQMPESELEYLAALVATRVATPDVGRRATVGDYIEPERLSAIRGIIERASREYLVDFSDEDFSARLALHLHNLVNRARDNTFSRNPLTQSMKASYPMIYELAVFVASELQQVEHIDVNEDEIAYIAMHLGSQLEQQRRTQDLVNAVIVTPAYHEIADQLQAKVSETISPHGQIHSVVTRADVDWSAFADNLVVTTLTPPVHSDRFVMVTPFFNEVDAENVRTALGRMRRSQRRSRIVSELLEYFDPAYFSRNLHAENSTEFIELLGAPLVRGGIIGREYLSAAIEREAISSTAFTESLAVPHAMTMTATRTAISIAINESPSPWGTRQVNVIALIAFSESGRASFQEVFDQFVEVFSDEANVKRFIAHATDFDSFIAELARLIEA